MIGKASINLERSLANPVCNLLFMDKILSFRVLLYI